MSIARTYAKALFESASVAANGNASSAMGELSQQLGQFYQAIEGSKELRVALLGPATSSKDKIAIIEAIAEKEKFPIILTKFLSLLAKKGRTSFIGEIAHALEVVRLESQGGILGQVVSAEELSVADLTELKSSFEGALGKTIEFHSSTDPQLLGGVKVTVNGVTYDGTLRSQLNRLKENFIHGPSVDQ